MLSVFLASLIAGLVQMVLHYFPWRMWLGKQLGPPWTYMLGTLGMLTPYVGLLAYWINQPLEGEPLSWALMGLAGTVGSSGLAVLMAYWFDAWLLARRQAEERGEELEVLNREIEQRR